MVELPELPDGLQPLEDLLDASAAALTQRVPGVAVVGRSTALSRCPFAFRATCGVVLGGATPGHEVPRALPLSVSRVTRWSPGMAVARLTPIADSEAPNHPGNLGGDHDPVAALHRHVPALGGDRGLASALPGQLGVRIGGRAARRFASLLAAGVAGRVPRVVVGRPSRLLVGQCGAWSCSCRNCSTSNSPDDAHPPRRCG